VIFNNNDYRPDQTLPQFAQQLQDKFGYYVTMHGSEAGRGIPGLGALKTADLLLLFVRREPLPAEQLNQIRAFLDAGKPLVALRTSSHGFALSKGQPPDGLEQWPKFDTEVLGGNYHGHFDAASGADVGIVPDAARHPLLAGIEPTRWHAAGDLYQVQPVNPDANVVLKASIPGQAQEPVAWFRFYKSKAPVFYTSLGHPDHFSQPQFVRLLTNAVVWALSKPVALPGPGT
jgi:type 1 glutamine amidotransferase